MTNYRITMLLTFDSGEEELRTYIVEAWNPSEAIAIAKWQARQDERVVDAQSQNVEGVEQEQS